MKRYREGSRDRHAESSSSSRKETPEYRAWRIMRSRCRDPRRAHHFGLKVAKRWDVFENFLADMGRKPSPRHTLDRKDGTKGYSPSNCRWATPLEQQQNTRKTKLVTFRGETLSVSAWARRFGVKPTTLHERLRRGWTMKKAVAHAVG